MIFGFILVVVIVVLSIFILWKKTRNHGLLWFFPQLIMQGICLHLFLQLIRDQNTVPVVMLSEENSLTIGLMGVIWAFSMVFMIVGVIVAFRNKKMLR